jgi:hypothetical protein
MTAKVTKSKNIISGKNAKIYPKCGSIGTSYDRVKDETNTLKRSHHKKKFIMDCPTGQMSPFTMNISGSFPKSISKAATILYKKLPDNMILITGFEGFLGLDEIFDRYGRVVAVAYTAYPYYMVGDTKGVIVSGVVGGMRLTVGQLHSKDGFSKIIAHVKKCGGLLHDIIAAVNGGEVKRIEI